MSDILEQKVRRALTDLATAASADRASRLRTVDYRPRRHAVPFLPAIGAGAVALTGVLAAAVLLLSTSTPAAFAGWTATPATPTAKHLTTARRTCGNVTAGAVVAAEARGPYTAITFTRAGKPWQCVVKGSRVVVKLSTPYQTRVYASVPQDKVMLPLINQQEFGQAAVRLQALENRYQSLRQDDSNAAQKEYVKRANELLAMIAATTTGPDTISVAIGLAGRAVTGVTFNLADGNQVHATVQNGWYVAWWPGGTQAGGAAAVRVAVMTANGTYSSLVPASPKLDVPYQVTARDCVPGDPCSIFVPQELKPSIAPSVLADYAMFRDTPPVRQSALPSGVRWVMQRQTDTGMDRGDLGTERRQIQTGRSLGLDPLQVRSVNLGTHTSFWLIPGSQGFCQVLVQSGGGGGSSCGPISSLPRYAAVQGTGGVTRHGVTRYFVGGFVPNGNATVTVHLASGAATKVPVRHNAFTASFTSQPVWLTFKDAAGKTVTDNELSPNFV